MNNVQGTTFGGGQYSLLQRIGSTSSEKLIYTLGDWTVTLRKGTDNASFFDLPVA